MRFATIGTSQITDRFLTAAKTCGDFRLEAVYSRSAGRAEKFAERHQAARWHDSLEKLAEDRESTRCMWPAPTLCMRGRQFC